MRFYRSYFHLGPESQSSSLSCNASICCLRQSLDPLGVISFNKILCMHAKIKKATNCSIFLQNDIFTTVFYLLEIWALRYKGNTNAWLNLLILV